MIASIACSLASAALSLELCLAQGLGLPPSVDPDSGADSVGVAAQEIATTARVTSLLETRDAAGAASIDVGSVTSPATISMEARISGGSRSRFPNPGREP